jgi:hypothetical protein
VKRRGQLAPAAAGPRRSQSFAGGQVDLAASAPYDVRSKTRRTVAGYQFAPPCAVGTLSRLRVSAIARRELPRALTLYLVARDPGSRALTQRGEACTLASSRLFMVAFAAVVAFGFRVRGPASDS